ncbi:MAG: hypothetical protein M3N16_01570 [Actinomycetota bacterium]|nr:hypothetical protein [Actinomycetota bacterium]
MVDEAHLRPVAHEELERTARRLLKTWQAADLVRRMDELIIASHGAYADRAEFLAEALRDRIEAEEERIREQGGDGGDPVVAVELTEEEAEVAATLSQAPPPTVEFGDWLDGTVPTLPLTMGPGTNFGLHNRDYPTLWAADWLGRLTAEVGAPVPWSRFAASATERAWEFAEKLQTEDLDRPRGAKVAAGFPTNRKKREATDARFREHFLGTIDTRGNRGPLFVFGLVGVDGERAALTEDGVGLLRALTTAGVGQGPPFSPHAWRAFSAHLSEHAREELSTWRRVLAIVAEKPDRRTLVSRCDWWRGAAADTNSMSLIARGREWGLVALALDEGRYQLTDLGAAELRAVQEQGVATS